MKNYPACIELKGKYRWDIAKGRFNLTCWVSFYNFLSSADFFQDKFFQKKPFRKPLECQAVWIQIRSKYLVGPDLGPKCLQFTGTDFYKHVASIPILVTLILLTFV